MQYDQISIWIIGRNEWKVIWNTLEYLLEQTYPLEKIEIIFVDGNSSDNTVQEVEKALKGKIKYKIINERTITNPKWVNYGHSWARNVAIMNIDKNSKYIARIDADCRADKNRLYELRNTIKNSPKDVAWAGWPRYVETQWKITKTELVLNYYFTSTIMSMWNPAYCERNVKYMPSIAGYNSIYKKEILEKYRYDTTYPFNTDDIEINYRITKDTLKFLYSAKAKIYHRLDETIGQFLKHLFVYGNGATNTSRLHRKIVRPYIPISVLYVLYRILLPLRCRLSSILFWIYWIALLPIGLIFLLSISVFIENISKAKTRKSIYVLFLVPLHVFMYGWWVIYNILQLKKIFK